MLGFGAKGCKRYGEGCRALLSLAEPKHLFPMGSYTSRLSIRRHLVVDEWSAQYQREDLIPMLKLLFPNDLVNLIGLYISLNPIQEWSNAWKSGSVVQILEFTRYIGYLRPEKPFVDLLVENVTLESVQKHKFFARHMFSSRDFFICEDALILRLLEHGYWNDEIQSYAEALDKTVRLPLWLRGTIFARHFPQVPYRRVRLIKCVCGIDMGQQGSSARWKRLYVKHLRGFGKGAIDVEYYDGLSSAGSATFAFQASKQQN
jgi:hypothetical protein